jgi:hypothetical protein
MVKLQKMLNVFCIQQPSSVGYLQGMNFVAGTILAAMQFHEEPAFWAMLQLFEKFQLKQLFDTGSQKFRLLNFTVEVLIREQLPELAKWMIDRLKIEIEVYTVKWFFSMWCIDLPFEYALTILDLYLIDQHKALVRTALSVFAML